MCLNNYLKEIRLKKGFSMNDVYSKTGITDSKLSRIEKENASIKLCDFIKLINCYELHIDKALKELGYNTFSVNELHHINELSLAELEYVQSTIDFIISHRNEALKDE